MHTQTRKKKKTPKRVLALPDVEQVKSAVVNSLSSKSGQRTYDHAITEFVGWYCFEPRLAYASAIGSRSTKGGVCSTITIHPRGKEGEVSPPP